LAFIGNDSATDAINSGFLFISVVMVTTGSHASMVLGLVVLMVVVWVVCWIVSIKADERVWIAIDREAVRQERAKGKSG
jgi:hypothetical protein